MAGEPVVTLVGNITRDPELRFTPSGKAVVKCNLAVTPRKKNRDTDRWEDMDTMWFQVSAWDQMAENVAESLSKGDRVVVVGRMSMRKYQTDSGEERQSWEIQADEISPSLRWAHAKAQKVGRSGGGPAPANDDPWNTGASAPAGAGFSDEPPF